jgi:hypothetical protein
MVIIFATKTPRVMRGILVHFGTTCKRFEKPWFKETAEETAIPKKPRFQLDFKRGREIETQKAVEKASDSGRPGLL